MVGPVPSGSWVTHSFQGSPDQRLSAGPKFLSFGLPPMASLRNDARSGRTVPETTKDYRRDLDSSVRAYREWLPCERTPDREDRCRNRPRSCDRSNGENSAAPLPCSMGRERSGVSQSPITATSGAMIATE